MAAEQLTRALEVLHRLLLLSAPLGDPGEALEVASPFDGAALRSETRSATCVRRQGTASRKRVSTLKPLPAPFW